MKQLHSVVIIGILILLSSSATAATVSVRDPVPTLTGNRYVLVTDLAAEYNRVILVDENKNIVREIDGLDSPYDAKLLPNGHILVAETNKLRVVEYDWNNTIVWKYNLLSYPYEAERLSNGNTLIAICPQSDPGSVIEVNPAGLKVWEKTGLQGPTDVERLANGDTLIPEGLTGRVIEIDTSGAIVWQKTGLDEPSSAERLANGNTLIAQDGDGVVVEINPAGDVVWQKSGYNMLVEAHRLPNGNTLITDGTFKVYEVDPNGTTVWTMGYPDYLPWSAYTYFSSPVGTPTITGPTQGKFAKPTSYDLTAEDPDGDPVYYYVDWGDGKTEWKGPAPSGTNYVATHTWTKKGDYTIKVKAADIYGTQTDWATLTVSMPYYPPFLGLVRALLERFPNAFPLLRHIFDGMT
jgi:hypothetical protein